MTSFSFKSTASTVLLMLLAAPLGAKSFVIAPPRGMTARPSNTELFLEDWVADMIDKELYRQSHKKEFENEWMEKNRAAVFHRMETEFMDRIDNTEFAMHRRDEKLAKSDPQKYCADRCVSTGNCDIYEDYFEMSPEEVIAFCTECVLSEEEDECDIPEGFYNKLSP